MNKKELIDSISANAALSKADAGRALDAFVESVIKTCAKKNRLLSLVLAVLPCKSVKPEPVAILKLEKPLKSKLKRRPNSVPVKRLRKLSTKKIIRHRETRLPIAGVFIVSAILCQNGVG